MEVGLIFLVQCLQLMKGLVDDIPQAVSEDLWIKDQYIVAVCLVALGRTIGFLDAV